MNENQNEKERQINSQISLLKSSGARLIDRLNNLSARLSPALRSEVPLEKKGMAEPADDESLVEIALNIRGIRYSIESETKLIIDILDRLEI